MSAPVCFFYHRKLIPMLSPLSDDEKITWDTMASQLDTIFSVLLAPLRNPYRNTIEVHRTSSHSPLCSLVSTPKYLNNLKQNRTNLFFIITNGYSLGGGSGCFLLLGTPRRISLLADWTMLCPLSDSFFCPSS